MIEMKLLPVVTGYGYPNLRFWQRERGELGGQCTHSGNTNRLMASQDLHEKRK